MPRRIGHVLLIVAVLSATGTHWLVLQSVAWTSMIADHLRDGSIREAVQRTFDGRHPCSLCRQIAKGKQDEKKSEVRSDWKKLEFSLSSAAFALQPPWAGCLFRPSDEVAALLSHAPPVPPPRSFRG